MRKIQKFGLIIASVAIIFTGCKKDKDPVTPKFSPEIVSVTEGSAATATITAGTAPFTATSSSTGIATASVEGNTITITGVAVGTTTVAVTGSDGGSANLAVSVNAKGANDPDLSETELEVAEGAQATVTITGGTEPFTATSSKPDVVTVTVSGRTVTVTGVDGGTALITVTGSDGGSAAFAVNVNDEQILFGPYKTQLGNGRAEFVIKRNHTIPKGVYTMVGWIYVEEGATLTIEPGTIIKGTDYDWEDKKVATGSTLIVKRGAKIIAEGTREEPIVFTSNMPKGQRQATDWGGIIICGKANNNQGEMLIEGGVDAYHGGTDDNDNSGILKFVRLEFGGYPYALDTEINGLTLGSVGRGTTLEYIQVSYCGDDSFEWFGGSVNGKYLVAYHGWDDDFDTDNGFSGKLQFLLGVRNPRIADQSNSNGFESDNNSTGSTQAPYTNAIFSNVTMIGPIGQDPAFVNAAGAGDYIDGYNWGDKVDLPYPIRTGIYQAAMQIRRNSRISCFNSVFTGYPVGLMIVPGAAGSGSTENYGTGSHEAATNNLLKIKNVFFAGMGMTGADKDEKNPALWGGLGPAGFNFSADYFLNHPGSNNTELTDIEDLKLNANWSPLAGSPLLGAADFTDPFLNDPYFTKVDYVGAFADDSDNWLEGWTNFDPQNTDY